MLCTGRELLPQIKFNMNQTELKFYVDFQECIEMQDSKIPKGIKGSNWFKQLNEIGVIFNEKSGRGRVYKINDFEKYAQLLKAKVNFENPTIANKIDSTRVLRNSKGKGSFEQIAYFIIKGNFDITIQELWIPLKSYSDLFGGFLISDLSSLKGNKVALIENKKFFIEAFTIVPKDFICIHKYGRWSANDFQSLNDMQEITFFGDYDLLGLDEFLKLKEIQSKSNFFVPENFDALFNRYSQIFDGHKKFNQNLTSRVKNTVDPTIAKIRDLVLKNNRILEQEALLIPHND